MVEKNSIEREIVIYANAEQVWKALTDPNELNRWYTKECEIDLRLGGKIRMVHGWGAWTEGTITELIDGQRLVFQTEDDSETIISLREEDGGVRVTIEYQMLFIGDDGIGMSENMAFGTEQFMKNAKSVLETGTDLRFFFWPSWIGLSHTSVRPDHHLDVEHGTYVLGASEQSPSQLSGLRRGDIIIEANGKKVRNYEGLETIIWSVKPEEKLTFKVIRNGKELQLGCRVLAHPRGEMAG